MYLAELHVTNFRSIRDSGTISTLRLQAFVGENNAGKSNILAAIDCLTSVGSSGIRTDDFFDATDPIVIRGTFKELSGRERRTWAPYLVEGSLILQKHISVEQDESGKESVKAEFHGYKAEPVDEHLSISKLDAKHGRVPWTDIVREHGLPDYFLVDGRSTKAIYTKALARYLDENEVAYDEPDLSDTQALGFPSRVVSNLPAVHFLKAITDYSSEVDKRATSTTFRRLMAHLSERVLQKDERFSEIAAALRRIEALLNGPDDSESPDRLAALPLVEARITELLQQLMPTVDAVKIRVQTDNVSDLFSRGVEIRVDDGLETEVLAKGHGLQRCLVFTLLRTMILNERVPVLAVEDRDNDGAEDRDESRPIMLLIEEPELYIHPQLCKLFYDTLIAFAGNDQVLYTTHSPLFLDAYNYESISVVQKETVRIGTKVRNCDAAHFADLPDRKVFQMLTQLTPAVNELFFARRVLLVEGPADVIAVNATLKSLKKIQKRAEELDLTVINCGGKPTIPHFQRVLNAFRIPYAVLHDTDITEEMDRDARTIEEGRNETITDLAETDTVFVFPHKLETSLGLDSHLQDQYTALRFFSDEAKITEDVKTIIGATVRSLTGKSGVVAENASVPAE